MPEFEPALALNAAFYTEVLAPALAGHPHGGALPDEFAGWPVRYGWDAEPSSIGSTSGHCTDSCSSSSVATRGTG